MVYEQICVEVRRETWKRGKHSLWGQWLNGLIYLQRKWSTEKSGSPWKVCSWDLFFPSCSVLPKTVLVTSTLVKKHTGQQGRKHLSCSKTKRHINVVNTGKHLSYSKTKRHMNVVNTGKRLSCSKPKRYMNVHNTGSQSWPEDIGGKKKKTILPFNYLCKNQEVGRLYTDDLQ